MKVIHSFVSKDIIWKELAYTQMLSALLAQKHYGNIHFYTTEKHKEQIEAMGVPYTSIDTFTLTSKDYETTSIPKIKTFSKQSEPFLHIDTDTLLYNKLDFSGIKSPAIFSHPDFGFKKLKGPFDAIVDPIFRGFDDNGVKTMNDKFYMNFKKVYLKLYLKLIEELPSDFVRNINLSSIPNMNVIYIQCPSEFKLASTQALGHYARFKKEIDAEEFGPCYIEQLYLHGALSTLNRDYRHAAFKMKGKKRSTLFSGTPWGIPNIDNCVADVKDVKWPLKIQYEKMCECGRGHKVKETYESIEDLKRFAEDDFGGFFHTSFSKWYDYVQANIIHQTIQRFGEEYVLSVHNYFKDIYKELKLPGISLGEKLYMKLFKNELFND